MMDGTTLDAREKLKKRYRWEIEAITQDIMNKLEMEVLTIESIASYLANLLMTHPRTKADERACETLMMSPCRSVSSSGGDYTGDMKPWEDAPGFHSMAYYAMGEDVLVALREQGLLPEREV